MSTSMLSAIERGRRMPTALVLDRIATALGTSIARLLRAEAAPDGVMVLRGDEQDEVDSPRGWRRRVLSPVLEGVEFEFMRTTLDAGVDAGTFLPHGPGSREYVAVERGTLRLTLDDVDVTLEAGDSIYFPGATHHSFANPSPEPCVYYLVMHLGMHADAPTTGGAHERVR